MIEILDVVEIVKDVHPIIKKGDIGTVVLVLSDNPYSYEIEFVDKNGCTIECLALQQEDVMLYWKASTQKYV